jgi:hypothetical protein
MGYKFAVYLNENKRVGEINLRNPTRRQKEQCHKGSSPDLWILHIELEL